jgi:Protein of unknown function (DUF2851)
MNEDFLSYAWAYRLYNTSNVKTTDGQCIQILDPGRLNRNSGPDFENAKIRIGRELWVGHVEIHVKAGDWYLHKHENDPAYQNVILHVVFDADKDIQIHNRKLPTLDLSGILNPNLFGQYQSWLKSRTWIPCEASIRKAETIQWTAWKDRLIAERLDQKSANVLFMVNHSKGNWKEVFYQLVTENFGFKVNKQAMALFASRIPWNAVLRPGIEALTIEAILFGIAGWLEDVAVDAYHLKLMEEYHILRRKHKLESLPKSIWQMGKSRPGNFPCIRIAQLAALICQRSNLYDALWQPCPPTRALEKIQITAGGYWQEHYEFGKKGKKNHSGLGELSQQNLLINTLPVFWYAYGKFHREDRFLDEVLEFLQALAPEQNQITRKWQNLGCRMDQALDTQSMIHLYNNYCTQKRCLQCQIGLHLMKQS